VSICENDDGSIAVVAIDPRAMFGVVDNPVLKPIVEDVCARLGRVIAGIAPGAPAQASGAARG